MENDFLSKLIETNDFDTVVDSQLNAKHFSGVFKRAFKYIQEFKQKYSKVPSAKEFSRKFPDIELTDGAKDSLKYYCDAVKEKQKHNILVSAIEEASEKINELETNDAYKIIKQAITTVENDIITGKAVHLNKDTGRRMESYRKRKDSGGITGLPTGIVPFDLITGGIQLTDLVMIAAGTGVGKANPLSTPVLTPNGFVPMQDIKVGMEVIGEDGKGYRVNGVFPQGNIDVYELTFADGTKSKCSLEHLWKYRTKTSKRIHWKVNTLEYILKNEKIKSGKSFNIQIPNCKPIQFMEKDLPLDPYVLGVLLGDGGFTTDRVSLTNPEIDIIATCNKTLKEWGKFTRHKSQPYQYNFKGVNPARNELRRTIKKLGLLLHKSESKFIPHEYLHSSVEQRMQLLKGLMDTDGHVSRKGTFKFFSSSIQLKNDFKYLCRSLGYRVHEAEDTRKGRINYQITILTKDVIVSSEKHLKRLAIVKIGNRQYSYDALSITDISFVGKEECQCISVDSNEHTYICDDFIVTHNTWALVMIAVNMAKMGYKVLFITREMSPEMIEKRADAMWNGFSYTKFNRGKLSAEEEEKFEKYLAEMEGSQFSIVFENAVGGVTSIATMIDRHSPDICLIDGGYLMTDDEEDNDWKGLVNVCRGFKNISLSKKIPIVTTMQMTVGEKVALNKLSFSKHTADEVDGLFGMEQVDMQKEMKEMSFKPLKVRDAEFAGKFVLKWDLDKMDFTPQWQEGVFEIPKAEERPIIQQIEEPKKKKILRKKNES